MTEYRRIGDYISLVDDRNTAVSITNLVGLTIAKKFIPSVANINGTDLSNYKIIRKGQFACSLMQVSRDGKFPVAMYAMDEPAIMSPAYPMFEVTKLSEILPEYMMLWFSRSEFDREACFYAVGGVRGSLDWEDFCNMKIPVPDIATQRRIVAEYQAVEKRIAMNERLIAKLEDTAQTIYKKMFVDDIDPAHLPDYLHLSTVGDFCQKTTSGGTPSRTTQEFWVNGTINWLKSGEVHNNVILDTEEQITQSAVKGSAAKLIPSGAVIMAMYGATAGQVAYLQTETTTNQACCNMICSDEKRAAYLFFHLLFNQDSIKRLANGGAQENLSQDLITKTHIFDSSDKNLFTPFSTILNEIVALSKENKVNYTLNSLLLSRLSE